MINKKRRENVPLSIEERLRLAQTLNALPQAQFDQLVSSLQPSESGIPDDSASQRNRSTALLEWAESVVGPGLETLEEELLKIISISSKPQTMSFTIQGKISENIANEELQAIIKLLRSVTGDDSIEISFIEEG